MEHKVFKNDSMNKEGKGRVTVESFFLCQGHKVEQVPTYKDYISKEQIIKGMTVGDLQGKGVDIFTEYDNKLYSWDIKGIKDYDKDNKPYLTIWYEVDVIHLYKDTMNYKPQKPWIVPHDELEVDKQGIIHANKHFVLLTPKEVINEYVNNYVDVRNIPWHKDPGRKEDTRIIKYARNIKFDLWNEGDKKLLLELGCELYRRQKGSPTNWHLVRL